jgi:hypothetical protein
MLDKEESEEVKEALIEIGKIVMILNAEQHLLVAQYVLGAATDMIGPKTREENLAQIIEGVKRAWRTHDEGKS